MPKPTQLTPEQKKTAALMRDMRLRIGVGQSDFSRIIELDFMLVAGREYLRTPWRESELQHALPAIITHLEESLAQAKALAETLLPSGTQHPKKP